MLIISVHPDSVEVTDNGVMHEMSFLHPSTYSWLVLYDIAIRLTVVVS